MVPFVDMVIMSSFTVYNMNGDLHSAVLTDGIPEIETVYSNLLFFLFQIIQRTSEMRIWLLNGM